jgi:hypothetical protein
MRQWMLFPAVIALALAATPCLATPIAFGEVSNIGTITETFSSSPSGQDTIQASAPVQFQFLVGPGGGWQSAILTLTASSSTPASVIPLGGSTTEIFQPNYGGTFTIKLSSNPSVNLLSGTFGPGAALSGTNQGGSAMFGDSVPPAGEVVFTSDFLTFQPGTVQSFSFSLAGVSPLLGVDSNDWVDSFAASGTGIFSADLAPEPLSFLLLGSGLLGLGLLRRKLK